MASATKRYKPDGLGGSGSGGDLVSIDRLQAAIASVGRVCLPSWVGSCCLVSLPNMAKRKDRRICILTNAHVIPAKEDARKARIEFEETNRDLKTSVVSARLEPDDFFVSNKELDFTLVALELCSAGKSIMEAAIDLNQTVDIGIDDVIHIVQHPSGGSKQISSQCITFANEDKFECTADAMPGSSGSPVFSNWQLAGIIYALRRDTGASCCTSMRAILKFIGAEVRPEEFLNKHRTLFKPELNHHFPGSEWEWVKSPSQLQPIDLWLPSTSDNQECVLLLGIPKGTLKLRTSALESKLPVLLDSYKEVSGTSVLVTKERIVTLTSSTYTTVNFRLKVLQVSSLSVPASRAVKATFGDKGSLGKEWFCIRNCKGKQLHIELVHVERSSDDIPVCFLSAHSKDDLIVTEETEKMSHLGQLGQAERAVMMLHPTRDTIFVQVFWSGKSIPKFELTVRSAVTSDSKLCSHAQCTICKKAANFPSPPIAMTPTMQPIVGPMYSLKIQRFSGNRKCLFAPQCDLDISTSRLDSMGKHTNRPQFLGDPEVPADDSTFKQSCIG